MSYKVNYVKVCSSLEEIKFKTQCEFCETLAITSAESKCSFCRRYFHYVQNNSCAIYTFRNFFAELALRKNIFNHMSWFDFQYFESELLDICENNLEVQYNSENLSFYFDLCNYDDAHRSILSDFDILHNKIVKSLELTPAVATQATEYLSNQLLSSKNTKKKEIIYTSVCLSAMKQSQNLTINREKLYEMFCDKFDFLN